MPATMPATTPTPVDAADLPTGAEVFWSTALDRLERDLENADDAAEGFDVGRIDPWQPPVGAPPLPESQMARALEILARQRLLGAELPELVARIGTQLRVAEQFSTAGRPGSVYLDVSA